METAGSLIESSLQDILVQAAESDLSASEYSISIKYLNRMMASFAVQGVNLGYTNVSSLGDLITVPDGAIDGMVANLAIRLFPQFAAPGTPINAALAQAAIDGFKVMQMLGIEVGPTSFAGAPIGSGSEDDWNTNHFYPEDDESILTEQGGFIATEEGTV